MNKVHGTFKSFAEVGKALGVKAPKAAKEKERKCEKCGNPLRHVAGTNVWMCDFAALEDKEVGTNKTIQVFTRCRNTVIDEV